MKAEAEFLRHEYTWSKQSIGGTIGLGVTASSTPKDKIQIREIEKIAAMAEPDGLSGMEVELLTYSEEAGFVKLAVKPVPAGEDQRQNKKVYLYQYSGEDKMNPDLYCIPHGSWVPGSELCLTPVTLSENWDSSKNILVKYHLVDRLPELFRAVFECVFRSTGNLAFLVSWRKVDYAAYSREIMYAIHSLLPEELRKNAGYASFGCGMNQRSSFYFTDHVEGKDYFDVNTLVYHHDQDDKNALDEFFYDKLATLFWQNEALYRDFIAIMQREIRGKDIEAGILKKLQWIFLQFCMENQIDLPMVQKMMKLFPQLFYRAGNSADLEEIRQNLLDYYHTAKWDRDDYENYLNILAQGMSKKGENAVLGELNWTFCRLEERYHPVMKDILQQFRQKYKTVYTRLMTNNIEDEKMISRKYFLMNSKDLTSMESYISYMDPAAITEEAKNAWLLRGIEIVNEDVFVIENFRILTRIASTLGKKEEWKRVLKQFLEQLNSRCEELDDEQLQAACEIENIYEQLSFVRQETRLKMEKAARSADISQEENNLMNPRLEEDKERVREEVKEYAREGIREEFEEDAIEGIEEDMFSEDTEKEKGHFLPFLIRGIPYGFLTGCILYLLNYGLVIGHWKISMGVGGMWLILILNYATERIERKRKDGYRLWQALGLCLVEGYIIQTIAWVFLSKTFRIYFFLLLGFLTVVTQCIHGLFLFKKREEEEQV